MQRWFRRLAPAAYGCAVCILLNAAATAADFWTVPPHPALAGQVPPQVDGRVQFSPKGYPPCGISYRHLEASGRGIDFYYYRCGPAVPYPPSGLDWYASFELVPLFRDVDHSVPFATIGAEGPVALSTSDFDTDFDAGGRVTVGHALNDCYRIEMSYMGSYNWSDFKSVRSRDDVGNLFSPFSNFGEGGVGFDLLDFNDVTAIEFSSDMDNVELNLRYRLVMPPRPVQASALLGVRYVNINEDFGYFSASDFATNQVRVSTQNDLIAAQIGLLGQFLCRDRFWIDAEIKGGIAANSAQQATVYQIDGGGGSIRFDGSRAEDRTSFIGDISVVGNYHFCPSFILRVGYQATWITGVALAEHNFESNFDVLTAGPAHLDHSEEIVYHGVVLGVTWVH